MRLFFLLLITLVFSLFATEGEKQQKVTLGLGIYTQTQPYKDVNAIVVPSPVIFFDNGIVYVRWSRGGIYFVGNKSDDFAWGFSLTAQPRPYGYKPSDSHYLSTLGEKEQTLEGGIAFSAAKKDLYIETMILTDLFAHHDSWLFKTEIGDKYTLGKFNFYPSIIVSYQSKEFMEYYYGVQRSEINPALGIEEYHPAGGFQVGVQTYISYPLTQNISAFFNLRVDKIPNTASTSPILESDYIYSSLASLIYTFSY